MTDAVRQADGSLLDLDTRWARAWRVWGTDARLRVVSKRPSGGYVALSHSRWGVVSVAVSPPEGWTDRGAPVGVVAHLRFDGRPDRYSTGHGWILGRVMVHWTGWPLGKPAPVVTSKETL